METTVNRTSNSLAILHVHDMAEAEFYAERILQGEPLPGGFALLVHLTDSDPSLQTGDTVIYIKPGGEPKELHASFITDGAGTPDLQLTPKLDGSLVKLFK